MTRAAPKIDHGKAFEKVVHVAFKDLYKTLPMKWERVVDSHDAGNTIAASDCDFKLTIRSEHEGRPWVYFIECKASIKYTSLTDGGARRSLIKANQVAKMRMALRAGARGLYLFQDVQNSRIEVWEAAPVIEAWGLKRTKWNGTPMGVFSSDMLETWSLQFVKAHLPTT